MSNDSFNNFLKTKSRKAPAKPASEFAQLLNKIEKPKAKPWSLWLTAAVAFSFIGLVSIKSIKQSTSINANITDSEIASLEAYIESEFYSVSLQEDEELF